MGVCVRHRRWRGLADARATPVAFEPAHGGCGGRVPPVRRGRCAADGIRPGPCGRPAALAAASLRRGRACTRSQPGRLPVDGRSLAVDRTGRRRDAGLPGWVGRAGRLLSAAAWPAGRRRSTPRWRPAGAVLVPPRHQLRAGQRCRRCRRARIAAPAGERRTAGAAPDGPHRARLNAVSRTAASCGRFRRWPGTWRGRLPGGCWTVAGSTRRSGGPWCPSGWR